MVIQYASGGSEGPKSNSNWTCLLGPNDLGDPPVLGRHGGAVFVDLALGGQQHLQLLQPPLLGLDLVPKAVDLGRDLGDDVLEVGLQLPEWVAIQQCIFKNSRSKVKRVIQNCPN